MLSVEVANPFLQPCQEDLVVWVRSVLKCEPELRGNEHSLKRWVALGDRVYRHRTRAEVAAIKPMDFERLGSAMLTLGPPKRIEHHQRTIGFEVVSVIL